MIRKILSISLLGLLGLSVSLSAAGDAWMTDFEAAQAKAAAEQKPLLLEFTGSDWCPPCMMLNKEVFSQETFLDYAAEALVLVKLDFPKKKAQSPELKAQNEALAQKYGIRGFPTILILSPEGEVVGTTGYRRGGAKAYVEHLKQIVASAE
jgi:protein disulfide-isomerase